MGAPILNSAEVRIIICLIGLKLKSILPEVSHELQNLPCTAAPADKKLLWLVLPKGPADGFLVFHERLPLANRAILSTAPLAVNRNIVKRSVVGDGFEPSKRKASILQSAPVGHLKSTNLAGCD